MKAKETHSDIKEFTQKKSSEQFSIEQENENLKYRVKILEEKIRFYDREYEIKLGGKRPSNGLNDSSVSQKNKISHLQTQLTNLLEAYSSQGQQLQILQQRNIKLEEEYSRFYELVNYLKQEKHNLSIQVGQLKSKVSEKKKRLLLIVQELKDARTHFQSYEKENEELVQELKDQLLNRDQVIENLQKNYNEITTQVFQQQNKSMEQSKNQIAKNRMNQQQLELSQFITNIQNLKSIDELDDYENTQIQQLNNVFKKLIEKLSKKIEQKRHWKKQYEQLLNEGNQGRQIAQIPKKQDYFKLQGIIKMLIQFLFEFIAQNQSLKELNYQLNPSKSRECFYTQKKQKIFKLYVIIIISILRMKKKRNRNFAQFRSLKIGLPLLKNVENVLDVLQSQQNIIQDLQENNKYLQLQQQTSSHSQQCFECIDCEQSKRINDVKIKKIIEEQLEQDIIQYQQELNSYRNLFNQTLAEKDYEIQVRTHELKRMQQLVESIQHENYEMKQQVQQYMGSNAQWYEMSLGKQKSQVESIEHKFVEMMHYIDQLND